jgi:murein DD-endopeptidase MepM/ murein hydrolase activator NlpD
MLRKKLSRFRRRHPILTVGALLLVNVGLSYNIVTNHLVSQTKAQTVLGTETIVEESQTVSDHTDSSDDDVTPGLTIYTVKSGDTISSIAKRHGISENTIFWANELKKTSTIKVGQELVILPINGIQYTVKSGDTISGIAKKFDAEQGEILEFNDLENASEIKTGLVLIIPDAEPTPAPSPTPKKVAQTAPVAAKTAASASVTTKSDDHSDDDADHEDEDREDEKKSGTFINPAPHSVLTQGLHAVNAVDFGAKLGTPILAAASGTVVVAKGNGAYNGGFGNFIVISHGNGVQTLYAHLSKVQVSVGDSVDQGEQIGLMGSTGKSTGSHLHFEIHGSGEMNPYAKHKKGTAY